MGEVTFTREEAEALFELIGQLSGHNPEYAFANDGTDSMDNPTTRACVLLYTAAGHKDLVPKNLQ